MKHKYSDQIELSVLICLFILLLGFVLLTPTSCQTETAATAETEAIETPLLVPLPPSTPAGNIPSLEIVLFQFSPENSKLDISLWYSQNAVILPLPSTEPQEETHTADTEDANTPADTNTDISLKSYIPPRYGETLTVTVVGAPASTPASTIYVHIYNATDPTASISRTDAFLFFADILDALSATTLDTSRLPIPAILAQAYTEGGAGRYGVYRATNNLFGIRAGPAWKGAVYSRATKKTYASYSLAVSRGATDLFRAYPSIAASLDDYITLVTTSPLYTSALGKSPKKYLQALTSHGYGDTSMVSTWMQIIKLYGLNHPEKIIEKYTPIPIPVPEAEEGAGKNTDTEEH